MIFQGRKSVFVWSTYGHVRCSVVHIRIFRYKKFMYDLVFSRRNAHLSVGWELIPLWRFEPPALLNPFKPDRPDGRLNLTAGAFNQLGPVF